MAAVTCALLVRAWSFGGVARVGIAVLVLLQIVSGGDAMFYSGSDRLESAVRLIRGGFDGRGEERFSYLQEYRNIGAAIPSDGRVVLHNYRLNLGIDRDLWLDWPGQQGQILYEDIHGPKGLLDYYHSLGVTHLLHMPGQRPTQTKQDDIVFHDLVRYAKRKERFGSFELVEVPSNGPAADHPYMVLAWGLWGYADGLYPLEAMKTYEGLPSHLLHWPSPEVAFPGDPVDRLALTRRADAVLVGAKVEMDPALRNVLNQRFVSAVQYHDGFDIYLRRIAPPLGGRGSAPEVPSE
jgi:hypothetical protein